MPGLTDTTRGDYFRVRNSMEAPRAIEKSWIPVFQLATHIKKVVSLKLTLDI